MNAESYHATSPAMGGSGRHRPPASRFQVDQTTGPCGGKVGRPYQSTVWTCARVALVLAVLLGFCSQMQADAPLVSVSQSESGWTYTWDPDAEVQNETHLITSIPSALTGPDVAPIIGADRFYNNSIDGTGTISSNIEAGHVWGGAGNHETLSHVATFVNHATAPGAPFAVPAYDRHATWVGMMIGGRRGGATQGQWQEGIAPQTDLRSGAIATGWTGPAYSLNFSLTGTSLDFACSSGSSGFGTADVINSSWGSTGAGALSPERQGTDFRSMIVDSLANGDPRTTFVASAGNSGISIGTNSVGAPGAGYNGITVGALQNDGSNN